MVRSKHSTILFRGEGAASTSADEDVAATVSHSLGDRSNCQAPRSVADFDPRDFFPGFDVDH